MSYEICAGGGIGSRFYYDVEQTDFQQKAHFEIIVRTAENEQQWWECPANAGTAKAAGISCWKEYHTASFVFT